jgi:neutral ceramidase
MVLKAGLGIYNVTPPLGVPMAGYAQREGGAEDVHDELTARAVVFECEGRCAALIALDTCMLPVEVAARAAERIEERTGIPAGCVVAASVHTHSGPALREENAYRSLLSDLMASAAELAWRHRAPARVRYGCGTAKGLCVNRRVLGGPVDEEFSFLAVQSPRGRTRGVLFSYPLHGVVMGSNNLAISADYLGVARRVIEEGEPGARAVFVAAPSGEMNPLTPAVKKLLKAHGKSWHTADPLTGIYDRTTGTFREVEQLGSRLGRAVLKALPQAEPLGAGGLVAKTWTLDVGAESPVEIALGSIRIGDAQILALPGEHLVATGFALKEMLRSAGLRPVLLTHAGQLSYVPPPEAFPQGGYEVELARRRGLATDAQPRILESVRRELLGA